VKPCPKCPSGKMSGPCFVKTMAGEALRYHCSTCGYSSDEPCADAASRVTGIDRLPKWESGQQLCGNVDTFPWYPQAVKVGMLQDGGH
jgi:hypothetical protein